MSATTRSRRRSFVNRNSGDPPCNSRRKAIPSPALVRVVRVKSNTARERGVKRKYTLMVVLTLTALTTAPRCYRRRGGYIDLDQQFRSRESRHHKRGYGRRR